MFAQKYMNFYLKVTIDLASMKIIKNKHSIDNHRWKCKKFDASRYNRVNPEHK